MDGAWIHVEENGSYCHANYNYTYLFVWRFQILVLLMPVWIPIVCFIFLLIFNPPMAGLAVGLSIAIILFKFAITLIYYKPSFEEIQSRAENDKMIKFIKGFRK